MCKKISVNAKELSEKSGRRSIWNLRQFRFPIWSPAYPTIRIQRRPSVLALLFQCRQLFLKNTNIQTIIISASGVG